MAPAWDSGVFREPHLLWVCVLAAALTLSSAPQAGGLPVGCADPLRELPPAEVLLWARSFAARRVAACRSGHAVASWPPSAPPRRFCCWSRGGVSL